MEEELMNILGLDKNNPFQIQYKSVISPHNINTTKEEKYIPYNNNFGFEGIEYNGSRYHSGESYYQSRPEVLQFINGTQTEDPKFEEAGEKQQPKKHNQNYETLRFQYIKELENPNLVGYDEQNDRWTSPPAGKGYDPNGIGIGLDKYTNTYVRDYLRRHNKDWLSMDEMIQLQNKSFEWAEGVLNRNAKNLKMSDVKRAVAIGLIYHGHGKKLWNTSHSLHKALFNGSDKQFIDAVTEFYKGNSRSTRHKNFWNKFV